MNQIESKLKTLHSIIESIYTARNDMHPAVAAQFHVEMFVKKNKTDKYFESLLDMEIEDCSRAVK